MFAEIHQPEEQPPGHKLTGSERIYLLRLARECLVAAVNKTQAPEDLVRTGSLGVKRASFVTLREEPGGTLRGCRGECPERRPLVESVRRMAAASALDDPRFPPVQPEELETLSIEISALTQIHTIQPEDVQVGRHGLLIISDWHAGLLLPQVATSFGWDREQLLRGLCRKAGLEESAWTQEEADLYAFETETWAESEIEGT